MKGEPENDVSTLTTVVQRDSVQDKWRAVFTHRSTGQEGTTLLQMQIGFVRLLLGAGYRVMKGACALDH